jgi:uncharacterized membrane protein YdbT with pleckstrin-like domain
MIGDFRLDDPDSDARPKGTAAPAATASAAAVPAAAVPAAAVPAAAVPAARKAEPQEAGTQQEHAARVQAHEAATGWGPEHVVRLASLTSRIAKLERQAPVTTLAAVVALLVGTADVLLAAVAIVAALTGDGDRAETGVLIVLSMFVPTVWAAWILTRLVQRRRVHAYRAERERLRRNRGCGDLHCARCA